MARNKRSAPSVHVLLPYAKQAGPTSFSSLWSIKRALGTEKVGHTGTLDSFAEGLLVVLSGQLTHLVAHVTNFRKTYQAVVCFGRGTDTLDPGGMVTETGLAPERSRIEAVLGSFTGALLQVPPAYSAVHVAGRRASDAARGGEDVRLEARQVFVYRNELLDYCAPTAEDPCAYALLEITCSKGTYIRALARDIAAALGTCAHLSALRRTAVGPFLLEEAAGASALAPFTIAAAKENDRRFAGARGTSQKLPAAVPVDAGDIRAHARVLTPELARRCGFATETLLPDFEGAYYNGRPLRGAWFSRLAPREGEARPGVAPGGDIAVFSAEGRFAGLVQKKDGRLRYGFVVPRSRPPLRVFSWDALATDFPAEWRARGTALSVGSFDGMHAGHRALLDALCARKELVPGIVTFSTSPHRGGISGAVSTLPERLSLAQEKGISFAIVIDFSPEFSRMEGGRFLRTLQDWCGMRFLAEGRDFACGHNGALTMQALPSVASELGFALECVPDVEVRGERASSSRVRDAVGAGDFALAEELLLRPYAIDCAGFAWQETAAEGSGAAWFSAPVSTGQVLPPDGTYGVQAVPLAGGLPLSTEARLEQGRFSVRLFAGCGGARAVSFAGAAGQDGSFIQ